MLELSQARRLCCSLNARSSNVSAGKYLRFVFRDNPVRRTISRIGIPCRKRQRRITLNKSILITPHPPKPVGQGVVQTWDKSQ